MAKKKPNPRPTIDDQCYICERPYSELHEVFFGNPDARLSQDYGMVVRLCAYHHRDHKAGVHHNREFDLQLKTEYKAKFEEMYPDLNFCDIFKCAWLMEVDDV